MNDTTRTDEQILADHLAYMAALEAEYAAFEARIAAAHAALDKLGAKR